MKQVLLFTALLFILSCNSNDKTVKQNNVDSTKINKPITVPETQKTTTPKTAIINILDTITPKMIVVYMKDSAKTYDRIGPKLAKIYSVKLGQFLKKNNLKMAGAPMAWYKTQKSPFFFEAGVPIDKEPSKFPDDIFMKKLNVDSAMVAHFYGPYNILSQGYDAVAERMKDEKKLASAPPYEIYIGDPVDKDGKPIDPYKVRTDIVFPRK